MNLVNFLVERKKVFNALNLTLQIDTTRVRDLSAIRRLLTNHSKYLTLKNIRAEGRVNVHNFVYYLTHAWTSFESVSLKYDEKVCFF